MDIFQAILERRSVRKFTEKEVKEEDLTRILEAGIWAPSGLNNQPWRFVVVREKAVKEALSECTKYGHIVKQAKVLIVVFLAKSASYHHLKDVQAIGACIQNMLLAIHALGLGGVWLGEILNQENKVHQVLQTSPEDLELMAVIALGYPAQRGSSSRKDLRNFILKQL